MTSPILDEDVLTVRVADRTDMEAQLEQCVTRLRDRALALGDRGILVTRHSASDFTIELHPEVPYGITHEREEW